MNNAKRKALIRFEKIKALKKQRRKDAISKFVDNASPEMKIAIAKQILSLQRHETIDDHPVYGWPPRYTPNLRPELFILDDKL